MPSITRQQLIAWGALALVILLVGAYYLRGQVSGGAGAQGSPALTMAVKEQKPATTAFIKVHVTGAVNHPGLYEMTAGDRVADALAAAGGAQPDAELAGVNLAAKLADGQQVLVPRAGEALPGPVAGDGSAATGSGSPASGPVNLNSATVQQLENLEGVGPKTAQKIVEYREANGGFKTIEELMEVPGIGPAKFDQIKEQVSV